MSPLLVLPLLYGLVPCSASNILIVSTVASPSHSIWCNKLAQLLVDRGHMVTILDTDPPRKKVANLTTYTLEGGYAYAEDLDYAKLSSENSVLDNLDFFYRASLISCKGMLSSPTLKRFLTDHSNKKKPFDLIIQDITISEGFLGLVPALGNPKLLLVTAYGESQALYMMGSQGHMIHSPLQITSFSHPMGFVEKLKNLFYTLYNYHSYHRCVNMLDAYSKDVFGQSNPHVVEIGKSAAVALVNGHPILNTATYYSPAIVHIPGLHIDEPKKLDVETQKFLDDANHGAIYFSLGTNIKSSLMSEDRINIFLNVFRNLKQRVLWKFETSNIKNLPKNVKISEWFSQNDVLAHPNVKLFITHAGLLSTQEAIYHAVPVISMPFWIDQHPLSEKLSKHGVGVSLSYAELTETSLKEAIDEVLDNKRYSFQMKSLSEKFTSLPMKPKDLAVFWVENVLKIDDLSYLKPPETFLSSLELFFFDLKTILGVVLGILITLFIRVFMMKNQKKLKKH